MKKRTHKRFVMERMVRDGSFPDRTFDVVFWQKCGVASIAAAADDMIKTALLFKGKLNPRAYRLRRSVENIQRA